MTSIPEKAPKDMRAYWRRRAQEVEARLAELEAKLAKCDADRSREAVLHQQAIAELEAKQLTPEEAKALLPQYQSERPNRWTAYTEALAKLRSLAEGES